MRRARHKRPGKVLLARFALAFAEHLRLNKVKFSRFPLWRLLHWSDPPNNFDEFLDPPPPHVLTFQVNLIGPPLWILPKFSVIPPFGFSVTTDPPFCSPKNQVIPLKSSVPPPAINNDRCTFETSHIDNKSLKYPGYSFIVELHLIRGHNLEKE